MLEAYKPEIDPYDFKQTESDKCDLLFILKDEAQTIEGVIKSFWNNGVPVYTNLFIGIDDKTTDRTKEIVTPYATKVFDFTFNNDFSGARNKVIELFQKESDSEWAIMPDGHEYLSKESLPLFKYLLQEIDDFKEAHVITPYFGMYEESYCCQSKCGILDYPDYIFQRPVMFRRGLDLGFNGPIHNYLYAPYPHNKVMPGFMFEHRMPRKRLEKRLVQRKEMNLPGLTKQHKKNTKDPRALFYLAQTYADQGDVETAIKYYKKHFKVCKFDDELAESRLTCGILMNNAGKYVEAKNVLIPVLKIKWARAEVYFQLGKIAFCQKKYDEAIHWFKICTEMKYPITHYFIRPGMYNLDAYDALMDCYAKIGEYREALKWAIKVRGFKPDCTTVEKNIGMLTDWITKSESMPTEESGFMTTDVNL